MNNNSTESKKSRIGEDIFEAIGSEVQLLAKVIPEMEDIIPSYNYSSGRSVKGYNFEASKKRWRYAFRQLARVFSLHFSPLVLVLDEMPWADATSLDVMELLLSDSDNNNPLMIIGCNRSSEINDSSHILSQKVAHMGEKAESCSNGES